MSAETEQMLWLLAIWGAPSLLGFFSGWLSGRAHERDVQRAALKSQQDATPPTA